MELVVDRASVSAGDDVVPHVVRTEVPDDATLEQVLTLVDASGFHHLRAGGLTSWLVRAGRNGRPLAAVRLHYVAYIADSGELIKDILGAQDQPMLYFAHEHGRDPDEVRAEHLPGGR